MLMKALVSGESLAGHAWPPPAQLSGALHGVEMREERHSSRSIPAASPGTDVLYVCASELHLGRENGTSLR